MQSSCGGLGLLLLEPEVVDGNHRKKVQTAVRKRSRLIEPKEPRLSVRMQCSLLSIPRSGVYYRARPRRRLHEQYHEAIRQISETKPLYGYRKVALELKEQMSELTEK